MNNYNNDNETKLIINYLLCEADKAIKSGDVELADKILDISAEMARRIEKV